MQCSWKQCVAVLGLITLAGCSPDSITSRPNIESEYRSTQQTVQLAQGAPETLRARFVRVSQRSGGFAGWYLDGDGRYVLALAGNAKADAAMGALREEFRESGDMFLRPYRTQSVNFSYAELERRYAAFLGAALVGGGRHVSTRIDIITNRLVAGAEDAAHAARIRGAVEKAGIPLAMYDVRIEGKLTQLADLNQRIRPMVGGLLVTRILTSSSYINCTMGPIAVRNGELGFLINSHCTPSTASDGTIWHQINLLSADRVGVETYEAALTNCTSQYDTLPGVPTGSTFGCRAADAVWVKFDAGVANATNVKKGYIGRTTTGTTMSSTPWRIAGALIAVVGSSVQKTGRVTGTTAGTITEQCVDEFSPLPAGVSYVVEQCQTRASATANAGDSGSPIYTPYPAFGADAVVIEGMVANGKGCNAQGNNCTSISYPPWSNLVSHTGLSGWSAFLP